MLLKQSKVCSFSLTCVLSLSTYMYIHLLNIGNTTRGTYLLDNGTLLFQIKVEENAITEIQVVDLKANEEFTVTSGILSSFSF